MKRTFFIIPFICLTVLLKSQNDLVIEIAENGIDDNGNEQIDEATGIAVNSKLTQSSEHADLIDAFYAAGKLIDMVDFGYIHWDEASGDDKDPDGDANDWDNSFGEHNGTLTGGSVHEYSIFYTNQTISWDFSVPKPGYYILSFFSWDSDARQITPSYFNGTDTITLPNSNHNSEIYLVNFTAAGNHRIFAFGNDRNYLFHCQLFEVRTNPEAIEGKHPRISVQPDNLAAFREMITSGWINQLTSDCISDADYILANVDLSSFSTYSSRQHQGQLLDLAVAYIATGNASYANYGISALYNVLGQTHFNGSATWSYLGNGEYIMAISIAYDYFFEAMTAEQRTDLIRLSDKHIQYLFLHSLNSRHRGDNSHWWSAKSSNNWNAVINGGGLGLAALCFEGDNEYASDWLDLAIQTQEYFLDFNFDKDGAYTESFMYLEYAIGSASLFYKAMYENKGSNLIHRNDSSYLKSIHTAMYFWEPNKQTTSPFDQETRWGLDMSYNYVFLRSSWFTAANVYNDGRIQKYIRHSYGDEMINDRYHDYASSIPGCVLGFGNVDELPYETWNIPLSKSWPEFGKTVMRTGFDDINDYYFAIQSGLYGSHGHADQSSFILHAMGQVLVDDNYYDSIESSGQNVILVDGEGQAQSDQMTYPGSTNRFFTTDIIDFVSVESSAGYIENGIDLTENKRNVLFVKPTNQTDGYYILSDHIQAESSHEYSWGIIRQNLGPEIESSGNDNYLFDDENADLEIRFSSPENTTYSISGDRLNVLPQSESTEAFFNVLLYPTNAEHVIADVAKINEVKYSGFNIGGDILLSRKADNIYTYGSLTSDADMVFRREEEDDLFLAMFCGTTVSNNQLSVEVSDTINFKLFKQGDTLYIELGDQIKPSGIVTLTIRGISSGTYACQIDGIQTEHEQADRGVLTLELDLSEQHRILLEGIDVSSLNKSVEDTFSCTNYPNPFSKTTRLSYSLSKSSDVRIEVYSISGTKLFEHNLEKNSSGRHYFELDFTGYPQGVYLYRLVTSEGSLSKTCNLVR